MRCPNFTTAYHHNIEIRAPVRKSRHRKAPANLVIEGLPLRSETHKMGRAAVRPCALTAIGRRADYCDSARAVRKHRRQSVGQSRPGVLDELQARRARHDHRPSGA
jgi:hypothetical protein